LGKGLKSISKSFKLLRGSIKFASYCFNKLHSNLEYITYRKVCQERRAPIPPTTEVVGFLGAIL
jgi:hypothetical protein